MIQDPIHIGRAGMTNPMGESSSAALRLDFASHTWSHVLRQHTHGARISGMPVKVKQQEAKIVTFIF
jgi:hypothetical protein